MSGIDRGLYLMADNPIKLIPVAVEDGNGDKQLLSESLYGILSDEELEELADKIEKHQNE